MSRDPKSSYYDVGGIETFDVIRAKLTPEQFEGFLLGNAIKYMSRAMWKGDPRRDLEKANYYLSWLRDLDPENKNKAEIAPGKTLSCTCGTNLTERPEKHAMDCPIYRNLAGTKRWIPNHA